MSAKPTDGLTLDGSLSYLDFQYNSTGASGVPLTATTPYTPKWNYSFGIQYDYQLKSGLISTRFDGQYQSEIYTEPFNRPTGRMPGRFLGNARVSYTTEDKGWQVSLEVQNLFNKFYYQTIEDISNVAAFGSITAAPGLLRTWAVTVRKNF
jgi:iron complex outermembrane receptor protein